MESWSVSSATTTRRPPVDGKVVDIPSYSVQPGQVVGVRERDKNLEIIREAVQSLGHNQYSWLAWDGAAQAGTFLHVP